MCAKHQWLEEHIIKTGTQKMDHKHGMLEYNQGESDISRATFQEPHWYNLHIHQFYVFQVDTSMWHIIKNGVVSGKW